MEKILAIEIKVNTNKLIINNQILNVVINCSKLGKKVYVIGTNEFVLSIIKDLLLKEVVDQITILSPYKFITNPKTIDDAIVIKEPKLSFILENFSITL